MKPDFSRLRKVASGDVAVTARATTPRFDFVSRFFAPSFGIDEGPVTGSTHCMLGPFWEDRFHKSELVAYQASARGGILRLTVGHDRVLLGGMAVTVLEVDLRT